MGPSTICESLQVYPRLKRIENHPFLCSIGARAYPKNNPVFSRVSISGHEYISDRSGPKVLYTTCGALCGLGQHIRGLGEVGNSC